MRVLISVDCEVASRGLCGVWKTQGWCAGPQVQGCWYTKLYIQLREHPLWIVQHKARICKATLDVTLRHRGEEGLAEGTEELELAHVVDMYMHQVLNLATICLLQRPKAADTE